MHSFLVKELLISNVQISSAETLSNVTNSSILGNPQFVRVSGCCYGYCDNVCDWLT